MSEDELAIKALEAHWEVYARGYAHTVCSCGWESDLSQPPEGQLRAHQARGVISAVRDQIAAEALREAADDLEHKTLIVNGLPPGALPREMHATWLRDRADRIRRGRA